MIDFLDMDSNKLVISEFYENDRANKYNYSVEYQREKVWSEDKKSFLIDSILKNYPIPPVFFRMKINQDTGITTYDVIDGKQRLTTIIDFINGNISIPDDFGGDNLGISELNGAYFNDLKNFEKYKRQFWKYRIPVIFIDTDDNDIIKNIFDRLNRNGEPLVPQELRHATYGRSKLYKIIESIAKNNIWENMFSEILEIDRMEDKEFISELLFLILEGKILSYTKETLDKLYEKWEINIDINIEKEYLNIMDYIKKLNIDYKKYKINKVSHLYAIWAVSMLSVKQDINPKILQDAIIEFFENYKEKRDCIGAKEYKDSMSSATKMAHSRKKRVEALIKFINSKSIELKMTL